MSNDDHTSPTIVVLTAPSGAGKTTIAKSVLRLYPNIRFSVSATTRKRRDHEEDGVHYHFVTSEKFTSMVDSGELLEYEEVYHNLYYGTLWSEVERSNAANPVLLDIDVLGAGRIKKRFGKAALVIFVAPPDLDTLRQRLLNRHTENPESLDLRLSRAKMEISMAGSFDHTVVNDDLETAVDETAAHIRSFLERRTEESAVSDDLDAGPTGND